MDAFNPDEFLAGAPPVAQAPAPVASENQTAGFDPDEFLKQSNEAQYGTGEQQAKTFVEGAAQGALGPLATIGERALDVLPQDIRNRASTNPGVHGLGEAAGLIGTSALGVGEGALMSKAGNLAADAVGLGSLAKEAPLGYRIGSEAVKQAAEMAVLQGSDEASKMLLNDPETSTESAIANVGLAAALGGAGGAAFGAVSPLWKATVGGKIGDALETVSSKLGGAKGMAQPSEDLAKAAGVEIPDIIKAKIDDMPGAAENYSKLTQTDSTVAGRSVQKTVNDFRTQLGDAALETLGHDSSYADKLPELDKYSKGQDVGKAIHDDIKKIADPISDAYDNISTKFKTAEVNSNNFTQMAQDIGQKSLDAGWHKAENSAASDLANRVLKKLPEQATAEDLRTFISNLRESNPFGTPTYGAAKDIAKILSEGQERAVESGILSKGGTPTEVAGLLNHYKDLKQQYAGLKNTLDMVNEHLHVGSFGGPKTFLQNLKEMAITNPEGILNRLSGASRADQLKVLEQVSPDALAKVRQYHVDKLIDAAKTKEGVVNVERMHKAYSNLSPQLQELVAPGANGERLKALNDVAVKMIDKGYNASGTARVIDKLTHGAPSPLLFITGMLGHGGAAIGGHLAGLGFKESQDALKLGMLKYMGSAQPVKAEGFKAMVDLMHNTLKGESMLAKGAQAVFKSGAQVTAERPTQVDRDKLDKQVTKLQDQPGKVPQLSNDSHLGHYMPDHQAALTQAQVRATQYLQQLKPQPQQTTPMGAKVNPTPAQTARYNRALDIAAQPNIVMQHIKDGTLQSSDIQDIHAMFPALAKNMANKLSTEMTHAQESGEQVPYRTKVALAMFLGQPIDGTMSATSIMAAQPQQAAPPQPQSSGKMRGGAKTASTMNKNAESYQTGSQAGEASHSKRH